MIYTNRSWYFGKTDIERSTRFTKLQGQDPHIVEYQARNRHLINIEY